VALSKKTRFEVFKRDLFTCRYCGRKPPEVVLEADHIVPQCEGGGDAMANLVTSCEACNRGKGGLPLGERASPLDDMELLANVQELLEQRRLLRHSAAALSAQREAEQIALAEVQGWWDDTFESMDGFDSASALLFIRRLPLPDILDAVNAADQARSRHGWFGGYPYRERIFRYFCGCCWRKIKETEGSE
jgi:hypothetical protein